MNFTDEHRFDYPLDVVRKAYFDPTFAPRKYAELGLSDIKVMDSDSSDDESSVVVRFKMLPTIKVPGFAQKFIAQDKPVGVEQTDRWNKNSNEGTLDIKLAGMSSMTIIHCAMRLEADGDQTVNHMTWTVEAKVPIVGGKLAKLLAEDIQKKSADDEKATAAILAEYSAQYAQSVNSALQLSYTRRILNNRRLTLVTMPSEFYGQP